MKILLAAFILWCVIGAVVLPSEPAPALHLTQLSNREWIDLSKISMIRLPVFTDPHGCPDCQTRWGADRSEEHTSELQSHSDLVCRLLLEKKKKNTDDRDDGRRTRTPRSETHI